MSTIHASALVDPGAKLGDRVTVGPCAVIGDDVVVGEGSRIGPQVVLEPGTRLGRNCRVFHGASIGGEPQDLKFGGERTTITIGDNTTIREFCTLNRGTSAHGDTHIGSDCLIMAYCHVAHDCTIGDKVIISNNLAMAGHVTVEDHVTIGGVVAIHQFVHIGAHSFIGAKTYITQDVVPFALCAGDSPRIEGINKIGLERRGFDAERRQILKRAYKTLFRDNLLLSEALERLELDYAGNADVAALVAFARRSLRGLLRM